MQVAPKHDTAGNLTTVTAGSDVSVFSYDSANRLIAKSVNGVPDTAYTWDTARGRRTAEGPAGGAPVRTFAYTGAGRLSAFTDASTGTSASYTYDATGQRTSSVVTQGSVTTTTTYAYEGLTLLSLDAVSEEGTAASSWRIDYLADATGRPYGGVYTSSEASSVAFGVVTTGRGDIRELTDTAGAPFARYDHDAYGNPTRTLTAATAALDAATAAAIAERNVLRYAGYAYDAHSGLYYLSQRYYDPATCQFITKDPAKADGEESAYQYCGGDPVGKVDPSGELVVPPVVTWLLALGSAYLSWSTYKKFRYYTVNNQARIYLGFGRHLQSRYPGDWRHLNSTMQLIIGIGYWGSSYEQKSYGLSLYPKAKLRLVTYVFNLFMWDVLSGYWPVI